MPAQRSRNDSHLDRPRLAGFNKALIHREGINDGSVLGILRETSTECFVYLGRWTIYRLRQQAKVCIQIGRVLHVDALRIGEIDEAERKNDLVGHDEEGSDAAGEFDR